MGEVFGETDAGVGGSEGDSEEEDAGHEVVDVADAGGVDGAFEDVGEHHYEQDRLGNRDSDQGREA